MKLKIMSKPITASMLYDLIMCPHRVTMDLFGDPSKRDPVSPFVKLLWERGTQFEQDVVEKLEIPFVDLSPFGDIVRERRTLEAMEKRAPLIYAGRIKSGDFLGAPDLLRLEGGKYVPGDIKSGAGEEGEGSNRRPKLHYAMQLAHYMNILEKIGFASERRAFVWDVHGEEIEYDLSSPMGPRTPHSLWDEYEMKLSFIQSLVQGNTGTLPAYSSSCKQCYWYSECIRNLKKKRDLTLIPELGRSKRDTMCAHVASIEDLAASDPSEYLRGKRTIFPGIGANSLLKFHERAKLLSSHNGEAYLKESLSLPSADFDIFFDIEVDPMRDICYLHGFVERPKSNPRDEQYVPFFADSPSEEDERRVFLDALDYLRSRTSYVLYYYSPYERTWWRKLQGKYPDCCSADEIEQIFSGEHAVDLYTQVVRPSTEWPTNDFSIKTLASHLGFRWRDEDPSGAASIEWYHRWVETSDLTVKKRILEYNEDDCLATRVLLDGLRSLTVQS